MTSEEKINIIKTALGSGKKVFICTSTKTIEVGEKIFKAWEQHGGLFKTANNSLFMRRGQKSWDCIDFCAIRIR